MEPPRVLCKFKLDTLDEVWVKSVWNAAFMIYDEPPDDYLEYLESEDTRSLLHESRVTLETWVAGNCDRSQNEESLRFSWQSLVSLNIDVHYLLAVLDYIMKTGQRVSVDEASRQACLEAASLYLMLLAIPGSNAFGVYHPNLYERVMGALMMSKNVFSSREGSAKETDAADGSNVDDELSYCLLSYSEKVKLVEGVNRIITSLITMLKLFRLRERAEALDVTIRTLLDITKLEFCVNKPANNEKTHYGLSLLSENAFAALRELCNDNHGSIALTIMLIAQYMLPSLSFHQTNNAKSRSVTVVQEMFIHFLRTLLKPHREETTQGIVTLLHQLMMKCSERAEGRQKQAVVIIKLLNICDESITMTVVRDIMLYSHHGKIVYRLFAQEIIAKLLTESALPGELPEDTRIKIRRILVAIVMSRCMDRSPLMRGKAIATLAVFSDCSSNVDKTIFKSIFKTEVTDKRFPTIDDLEKALTDDTNPLPGSDTLSVMLLDRATDERALVRRSCLKILRNLSVMFPSLMDRVMHVISERCRDSTLVVRQFAVLVLSEILERFPHDPKLLHEWTQAVIPQIYDIESKVQEKVLECLQSVLINRISNAADYTPDNVDSLPWKVLNKLSNMRMRKHLSKACSMWVKNGTITKSVIKNVQSHIGTNNDTGAWILLASLAENMTIPGIKKYIVDYKDAIDKNDFHASLVLHVLRYAWSCLDPESLQDLRQYIFKRMCHFQIDFNLISVCLDIFCGVLRHFDTNKSNHRIEAYMEELMKLSETKVQNILEEDEDDEESTCKVRAIFTLGHASLLCTKRISSSTLWILQRLLVDPESLPKTVRDTKDLQTFAVVLFCQQALRDREIAKKVTPMLGQLICQGTDPSSPTKIAVKINAAKALADICVRFTGLVEPYLPDMCISMKDPNPAVREAIVVIFTQLLLEDFIKIKGPFFFHVLTMLSDTDSMIRDLTIFLVEERLLAKNKTLISQQFLESIYYYNNYFSESSLHKRRIRDREKKLLTLPGRTNQDKRNVIYEFMLGHLDPLAKLKLVSKLTKYVLGEVCDGRIDVEQEEGECVLQDTLFIISNNRLQISSIAEKHKDDLPEAEADEIATPSQSNASATSASNNITNAIVAAMKKHNLDNLLPLLIALKKKLKKSPLASDVEKLLFKVYSDHDKDHMISLLNEYPELEKDMERYQRLTKGEDETTLEDEDNADNNPGPSSSTPTICHKDQSPDKHTLARAHHLPSTSKIPTDIFGRLSLNSCSESLSLDTKLFNETSVRLEKLSLTELSLGSSFSISTPRTPDVYLGDGYSPSTCGLRTKRPSSEIASPVSPRKISKSK